MRYKALEAQLRQSISKKEHHEIVLEFEDKMTAMEKRIADQEKKIAEQEKDLIRTKADLQRAGTVNGKLAEVGDQIENLYKAIGAQGKSVESLASKLNQGTVPSSVHQQALAAITELEERIAGMVPKQDAFAIAKRLDEATRRMGRMVPQSDYDALKQRVEELEGTIASMVPKEQFASSEATVKELRARLAEHIPQSTYDELVTKVVQLAEEVTGGGVPAEEQEANAEPSEPTPATPAEPSLGAQPESPTQLPPAPQEVKPLVAGAQPATAAVTEAAPEIREVGSQLAEINTTQITEPKPAETSQEARPNSTPSQQTDVQPAPEVIEATASAPAATSGSSVQNS